jgi:hypothetical protein
MLKVAQIVLAPVKHLVHNSAITLTGAAKREGTFDAVADNANLLQAVFNECDLDSFCALLIERSHAFRATYSKASSNGTSAIPWSQRVSKV